MTDDELRAYKAEGLSAAQIAERTGLTRGTVCGRWWRLNNPGKVARDNARTRVDNKRAKTPRLRRTGDWEVDVFEPYEARKMRLTAERRA